MDLELEPGSIFDRKYKITALLGKGGTGTVYKAFQPELDRFVAIKVLSRDHLQNKDNLKRLERESSILASLADDHIARFYSFAFSDDGIPYLCMEYVDGPNLRTLLCNSQGLKLNERLVLSLGRQLCAALLKAHQSGIVHRDIKPENILILDPDSSPRTKLIDFGIAKLLQVNGTGEGADKLTKTGTLLGSIAYMAPEQIQGKIPDCRSDIFSLAATLYECLKGELPFEPGTQSQPAQDLIPTGKANQDLSKGLELVICKGLKRDPSERYQSMEDFGKDLELVESGHLADTVAALSSERRAGIGRGLAATLVLSLLFIFLAGFYLISSPEGQVIVARFQLRGQVNEAEQLHWLRVAEKLQHQGAIGSAASIRQALAHSCNSELGLASLSTKLARLNLGKRDLQSAFDLSCASIRLLARSIKSRRKFDQAAFDNLLEEDCSILLAGKIDVTHECWDDLLEIMKRLGDNRNPCFHNLYCLIGQTFREKHWRCKDSGLDALELWLRILVYEGRGVEIVQFMPLLKATLDAELGKGNIRYPEITSYLAQSLYASGDIKNANTLVALTKSSLALCADSNAQCYPDIHVHLAYLESMRGNLGEAEKLARKAVDLSLERDQIRAVEACTALATIQREEGHLDDAMKSQKRAVSLAGELLPQSEIANLRSRQTAYIGLGECLVLAGKKDEAIKSMTSEIAILEKLNPFPVEAVGRLRDWLAGQYWKMGKLSQAEEQFRACIEIYKRYQFDEFVQCRSILKLLNLLCEEGRLDRTEAVVKELFTKSDPALASAIKDSGTILSSFFEDLRKEGKSSLAKQTSRQLSELACRICNSPSPDMSAVEKIITILKAQPDCRSEYLELEKVRQNTKSR